MKTLGSSGDFGGTDPVSFPRPQGGFTAWAPWCKGASFLPAAGKELGLSF